MVTVVLVWSVLNNFVGNLLQTVAEVIPDNIYYLKMNFVQIFKFNRETVFAQAVSNISLSEFYQFLFKLSLKYSS